MPDYGQKATDAEFRRLRAKINDVYKQAYKEIEQKGREFAQAHARREAQMRQMVADGKMTQADFDAWMRGQVFQGEQWQKKKQQMADTLYHADQVAQQMVNDSRYNVFAANANYMGYSLEHDRGIKTNFGLYDADSVRRLVKKEPDLLPPKKMVGKDKSYQWYNRQVQTAITQGIIQGESLDKIAHRIGKQTGETSMTAMLRNARTMQTGAQNAGRIEGLHQAQELGIKVKKQWMATLDSHTRDAHADLDGQIADVDEPFDSELGPIMYPGDPDADPANVWNCRCTLVYVYPEYPNSMERRDNETGENVGDMTYREWEEMKRGEEAEPEQGNTVVDGKDISETWERRPNQFDFEINDVIDAQGFDGNPRVVDADEFDRAVQESGFIAQRTYSAPDQETLDAYQDQLYSGQWYVDCSVGDSSFGQGMYCTPGNGTEMDERAIEEQKNYGRITRDRIETDYVDSKLFEEYYKTLEQAIQAEGITDPNAIDIIKAYNPRTGSFQSEDWHATNNVKWVKEYAREHKEQYRDVKGIIDRMESQYNLDTAYRDAERYAREIDPPRAVSKTETLTLQRGAKVAKYSDLVRDMEGTDYTDIGVYGAARGYDAIDIDVLDGQMEAKQTLILNRTKVIFRRS